VGFSTPEKQAIAGKIKVLVERSLAVKGGGIRKRMAMGVLLMAMGHRLYAGF